MKPICYEIEPVLAQFLFASIQVPCFRFNVIAVVMFTHAWMILGWIGSLQSGMLFEDASWEEFIEMPGSDVARGLTIVLWHRTGRAKHKNV